MPGASRCAPAACLAGAAVLAGCANPLGSSDSDYGRRVAAERLRDVNPLDLSDRARPEEAPETDPGANPFDSVDRVELSLERCRAQALANNLDLKVALIDPTIANESISAEEAAFESLIFAGATYAKTDTPTASQLEDAQAEYLSLNPGVRVPVRTGGSATITLPMNRTETTNQFSTLNPSYTTDLRFSLSHPLLRNAGRRASTYGIRVASYNSQISQAQAKLQVIGQLAAVDRAYWSVYQTWAELDVRRSEYDLAREQLERAQRLYDAGKVAEIEVIRAQAGVAERLEAIIRAANAIRARQRELKRAINIEGLGVDSAPLIDVTSPPDPVRYELDAGELVEGAVAQRMEMLELELRLAIDDDTVDLRRNQLLPLLDMTASYSVNGLGGSLSDSAETLYDNNFEDWSLGVNVEVPLGNEAARSRYRQAVLTRLQRIATRRAREQTITQEVLNAVDELDTAWQRVLAAQQSTVLNARALEAEQRQFNVGASTSTDVLDASARLANAQSAEIRAVVDYQIAQTNLAASTGTLLGASRITWEPLDPTRGPEG